MSQILDPVPEDYPDPDCPHCGGEGAPTLQQRMLADEFSYSACPDCWAADPHPEISDEKIHEVQAKKSARWGLGTGRLKIITEPREGRV